MDVVVDRICGGEKEKERERDRERERKRERERCSCLTARCSSNPLKLASSRRLRRCSAMAWRIAQAAPSHQQNQWLHFQIEIASSAYDEAAATPHPQAAAIAMTELPEHSEGVVSLPLGRARTKIKY